ncbi:hypothetical protein PAXRUDRAFT_681120 [Paxillus rubicundulus Ve08.2h10]|uniref:Uncharacterized protein n=1 Tax=Paxillus rubicundulus Ve08.2h10 TaxID=930991 RepID=A0A0D0DWL2_9AGAM|nr:hypothetical protein PAXRUDRAFT_681120 [Paxillus rubicundulus Ve08.2h10]
MAGPSDSPKRRHAFGPGPLTKAGPLPHSDNPHNNTTLSVHQLNENSSPLHPDVGWPISTFGQDSGSKIV